MGTKENSKKEYILKAKGERNNEENKQKQVKGRIYIHRRLMKSNLNFINKELSGRELDDETP